MKYRNSKDKDKIGHIRRKKKKKAFHIRISEVAFFSMIGMVIQTGPEIHAGEPEGGRAQAYRSGFLDFMFFGEATLWTL